MLTLPPLSLYVHIPWCIQKCPYCDFNSHAQKTALPEQEYVARLLDDLRADLSWAQGRPLESIFIGGGTPSLFSAAAIGELLDGIKALCNLQPNCEITLEANPGTFEAARFSDYQRVGVNRISLGVQSFNAAHLERLGRIHNPDQARQAAEHLQELGLVSFNLDLMHGLPDQSLSQAMADLDQAIALQPPHISWYQLTIEPNTQFASRPPQLPEDELLWSIQERGHAKLLAAGYQQYEVSAYAKPDHKSVHNQNYWQFGDYLGIGCGAHSKITLADEQRLIRCEKIKHPRGYLDLTKPLRYRQWQIDTDELIFEFFLNTLRLRRPIAKQLFEQRTGLPRARADEALAASIATNLIESTAQEWRVSEKGYLFLNTILDQLL